MFHLRLLSSHLGSIQKKEVKKRRKKEREKRRGSGRYRISLLGATCLRGDLGRSWGLLGAAWVQVPWKPPLFGLRTLGFIDAWLKKVL